MLSWKESLEQDVADVYVGIKEWWETVENDYDDKRFKETLCVSRETLIIYCKQ